MRAVLCKELGPPEKLAFEEVERKNIGPYEVRVAVDAAGVNFPDILIIQGKYQFRGQPPFTPGNEVAGTISEVGDKVAGLKAGDRVVAVCMIGGFSEEVVVAAEACTKLPEKMSPAEAAALPVVYGTTMHAFVQRAAMQPGETLLVLGAAGGVGLAAVQLGKLLGAKVIAAASSDEKLAFCKEHGADYLVNYEKESLKESVKKITDGRGADVIYDPVGGQAAQDCFSCIAWNGRFLVIGFASGTIPEIALNRLLLKGCSAVGVFWGAFMAREPALHAANMQRVFDWISAGQLKPHISKQYPMAEAPRALRDMMERKVLGKVVLVTHSPQQ